MQIEKSYKQYFLPTATIKDCNVMIDGKNFFDHPVTNDQRTYDNVKKLRQVQEKIT